MSYVIPDEIIKLYGEIEEAFQKALSENKSEVATSILAQMENVAIAQLGKASDEMKTRSGK